MSAADDLRRVAELLDAGLPQPFCVTMSSHDFPTWIHADTPSDADQWVGALRLPEMTFDAEGYGDSRNSHWRVACFRRAASA
jgi:hypothetical protein